MEWINEEKEAYAKKDYGVDNNYAYDNHALNTYHGYSKIKKGKIKRAFCFGGGLGEEIRPIVDRVEELYVLEPSKIFRADNVNGKKIKYIEPLEDGKIDVEDGFFDLITCLGVLHHVPNVSFSIRELKRTLKDGGYLIIREPTVSMGDWNKHRDGVTKRERGIPLGIFQDTIKKEGFEIISSHRVMNPFSKRIFSIVDYPFNKKFTTQLDYFFSKLLSFNKRYHSTRWYHKIQPQSIFYVLRACKE